jgi:RNA polymerase sigma factor (sigma-70 family)
MMATQLLPPASPAARRRTSLHLLNQLGDAQLLERFAARHSEGAFAVLVERHGPLVHGVCRRVLGDAHDAEDAFQATFLVLARKAHTIHKQQSLASWLYKVAYRVALRARADISRRRTQEKEALQTAPPPTPAEAARRELGQVIDEEVQRLPEKYRAPVLLCYLQGQTNEEAAQQLSCPTGTVKVRLMRARDILRKRLARRGVGLTLTTLTVLLLENAAHAAAPAALLSATVSAATTGGVSAPVAGLVKGTLAGMCLTKLKVAAALLLTVLIGTTADGLAQAAHAARPAPAHERKLDPGGPTYSPPAPALVARGD